MNPTSKQLTWTVLSPAAPSGNPANQLNFSILEAQAGRRKDTLVISISSELASQLKWEAGDSLQMQACSDGNTYSLASFSGNPDSSVKKLCKKRKRFRWVITCTGAVAKAWPFDYVSASLLRVKDVTPGLLTFGFREEGEA